MSDDLTPEDRKMLQELLVGLQRHVPEFAAAVNKELRERWRSDDPKDTDSYAKRVATGIVLCTMGEEVKRRLMEDGLIEESTWNLLKSMVRATDRSALT